MEHVPVDDDNEKKQPAQLLDQIRFHHQTFLRFQKEAKKASDSLARERESTSTQCSRIVRPLFQFNDHITTFCTLLREIPLPDHISKRRHDIQIVFQKIEPSLESLDQCIHAFASGNFSSQGDGARTQRAAILHATRTLEQNLSGFNELLGPILNIPPIPEEIDNKGDSDHLPKGSEAPAAQQVERASTDHARSLETQQRSLFMNLYELLANHTNDLTLREICRIVGVSYNLLNGDSHAERAFSLTEQLDNENRLQALAIELRQRLPGRFPDIPHNE